MYFIYAFFISTVITFLIVRYAHAHLHLSGDNDFDGPQKFHSIVTPRIGGLSIFLSFFLVLAFTNLPHSPSEFEKNLFLSCLPVFSIGLLEDVYKKVGVGARLLVTVFSAFLASTLLATTITSLDIFGIDFLLNYYVVSLCLTVFSITGLTNAYNIIDGFNGLSSMVAIITLLAIAYVGFLLGDFFILQLSIILACSIFGFLLFNFPKGLIFLGDGGAYLVGFSIALLSILLINRNSTISPWFALLINIYPITETLFSIYRRCKRKLSPGLPDAVHFHTLIYRRVLKNSRSPQSAPSFFSDNAKTSPILWVLTGLAVLPAILFCDSTPALVIWSLIFIASYIWIYYCLVCFRTPRFLKIFKAIFIA